MDNGNDFLHNQLIKLGDMMGDGLHYEPDGKWIEREYKQIAKLLYPEAYKNAAKDKRDSVDIRMAKLLSETKCVCGGELQQVRKGTKVSQC